MKAPDIAALERSLGHKFQNRTLLEQALTHTSFARESESQQQSSDGEQVSVPDNEQLEFLGDAILGFVTSEEICRRFPQFREGELSKLRAFLVSEKHLIVAAKKIKIGKYLHLGRGEEKSGGRDKTALQVDALEALLAAMYLDAGIEKPKAFILDKVLGPELRKLSRRKNVSVPVTDYKSALQETAHSMGLPHPSYSVVKEHGPQHNKTFTVEVRIRRHQPGSPDFVGHADGSTKKKGEQAAAKAALEYLQSSQAKNSTSKRSSQSATQ